jgi:hypothetical protein
MNLVVREAILAEELECGLHPTNGWDLSAEMDRARTRSERTAKAEVLSQQVLRIFGVLVGLGILPVQRIP